MEKIKLWWPVALAPIAAGVLYYFISSTMIGNFWPSFGLANTESVLRANLGSLGDVVGGLLNPVFTFISVLLLIKTIQLTQETNKAANEALAQAREQNEITKNALNITKQQLDVSTDELKLTRDEVAAATKAQQDMVLIQQAQKKENAFFEVYQIYSVLIEKLHTVKEFGYGGNKSPIDISLMSVFVANSKPDLRVMHIYQSRPEIRRLVKLTIMLFELSRDAYENEILLRSTLTAEVKIFLCMFGYYGSGVESIRVLNFIKDRELTDYEKLEFVWNVNNRNIFDEAMEHLDIPYVLLEPAGISDF